MHAMRRLGCCTGGIAFILACSGGQPRDPGPTFDGTPLPNAAGMPSSPPATRVGGSGSMNDVGVGGSGVRPTEADPGAAVPLDPAGSAPPGKGDANGGGEEPVPGPEPSDEVPEPTQPVDCDALPAAGTLEGWAAVAGGGIAITTGGGSATPIVVDTLAALRDAVAGSVPAVVMVRGKLEPGDTTVGSNKTIVGTCSAELHGHLELRESVNVIVRNITIVGYGEGDCARDPGYDSSVGCSSGDDAVTIQRNSHHVWFDHVAVRDGTDGNLDVSNGADFVTISWSKFSYTPRTDNEGSDSTGAAGHRYSNLVGGTNTPTEFDDANSLNVTWHHNWWADNVVERQPRIRFGQNHLYNNYYSSATSNYCIRAGIGSALLIEGNAFEGSRDPHEFNNAEEEPTASIALGAINQYTNATGSQQVGGGGPAFTDPPYDYQLDPAAAVPAAVSSGAGPH